MPDGIQIYISESLTPDQRELAEQSIASTVERMRAKADAARARSAEDDKLRGAITAPLAKLMRADPGAAEALEKLRALPLLAEDSLRPESPPGGNTRSRNPCVAD
jgi:hypothetical protein